MPTTIYLDSTDEFTVTKDYEQVLADVWGELTLPYAEFTVIWWTDPESPSFDSTSEWPTYREQRISIAIERVVAIERLEGAAEQALSRAREYARAE